jgi:hypothetical protein
MTHKLSLAVAATVAALATAAVIDVASAQNRPAPDITRDPADDSTDLYSFATRSRGVDQDKTLWEWRSLQSRQSLSGRTRSYNSGMRGNPPMGGRGMRGIGGGRVNGGMGRRR